MPRSQRLPMILVALVAAALVAATVVIVARPGAPGGVSTPRGDTVASAGGVDTSPGAGGAPVGEGGSAGASVNDPTDDGARLDREVAGNGQPDGDDPLIVNEELEAEGGQSGSLPAPGPRRRIPVLSAPVTVLNAGPGGGGPLSDQARCGVRSSFTTIWISQTPRSDPYVVTATARVGLRSLGFTNVSPEPAPDRFRVSYSEVQGMGPGPIVLSLTIRDATGRVHSATVGTAHRIAGPGCS